MLKEAMKKEPEEEIEHVNGCNGFLLGEGRGRDHHDGYVTRC
jgi:hypothetical protein